MICEAAIRNWRIKYTCSARFSTRSWQSRSEYFAVAIGSHLKYICTSKRAGYESVRKWTSRVDVFSKKYLVVPINEQWVDSLFVFSATLTSYSPSLHWYLAIIYQPEYILRPAPPLDSPVTRKRKRDEELSADSTIEVSKLRETPITASKPASEATTEVPDEAAKPEEQEVENQLCAEVSSVSLDEHEQEASDSRNSKRGGSAKPSLLEDEGMEIDNSTPNSPMHVDREVHIEDLTRESTPHGTTEPSVAGTEDTTTEAPAVEIEDSTDADAIPVQTFYGNETAPFRTYASKKPHPSAPAEPEGVPREGDPGDAEKVPLNT